LAAVRDLLPAGSSSNATAGKGELNFGRNSYISIL